ncbi:MAG: phosphatidylserine decarboxylase [Desulfuromonadales bacterium]|nr:phosphatidylserine decarboxylase [Desulfuromonadales bacterium]
MTLHSHQYIERHTGIVRNERLIGDALIRLIYHPLRERSGWLFRQLTGARASRALALLNYDSALACRVLGNRRFLDEAGFDPTECVDPPERLDTARKVFERRIRYWECRPMPGCRAAVVSPADARVLVGSLDATRQFFIKEKFFSFEELLGGANRHWQDAFAGGDFAIFRLTPDKYHYNHLPVAGQVVAIETIDGHYHSCNPDAVVRMVTPYSKNRRTVTLIDTDVEKGTGVGLVAMIEVIAMMIGDVVQCYSDHHYDAPQPIAKGDFLHKGQPKSLYRPGSSTDILLFQRGRVRFADDLLANQQRRDVQSRFSRGFQTPMIETDLKVRSLLAMACTDSPQS